MNWVNVSIGRAKKQMIKLIFKNVYIVSKHFFSFPTSRIQAVEDVSL